MLGLMKSWAAISRFVLPGVSKLFVDRLDDEELAVLERALDKVSLHCSFG